MLKNPHHSLFYSPLVISLTNVQNILSYQTCNFIFKRQNGLTKRVKLTSIEAVFRHLKHWFDVSSTLFDSYPPLD